LLRLTSSDDDIGVSSAHSKPSCHRSPCRGLRHGGEVRITARLMRYPRMGTA